MAKSGPTQSKSAAEEFVMIRLLYFAWARAQIGLDEERQTPPKSPLTVSEMLDWLPTLGTGHAAALEQRARLRVAVNQQFADPDTLIHPGDEVAVFPPVTGG